MRQAMLFEVKKKCSSGDVMDVVFEEEVAVENNTEVSVLICAEGDSGIINGFGEGQ